MLRGDLNLRYGGGMQLAKPKSPSKYPYWVLGSMKFCQCGGMGGGKIGNVQVSETTRIVIGEVGSIDGIAE